MQGGVRDVTEKESNILREGQRRCVTIFDYAAPDTF